MSTYSGIQHPSGHRLGVEASFEAISSLDSPHCVGILSKCFIPDIYIAPLQVHFYSDVLPTTAH